MGYLIASLVAPAAGPLLYGLLHDHPGAVRLVDGFVYLAVPVLVVLQLFPFAWAGRGWLVVLAVSFGFSLPSLLEGASRALRRHTDAVALFVGLSGLVLHASLEGAALVPSRAGVGVPITLAIIVHRVPVGLVIWWLVRPSYGPVLAAIAVGAVLGGTVLGYAFGLEVLGEVPEAGTELYQAFVSGSLVHVVFHQGRRDHRH